MNKALDFIVQWVYNDKRCTSYGDARLPSETASLRSRKGEIRDKPITTRCIMARPKSEFLSAMGVAWQIFQAIVNEVLSLGGNDEDMRRILKEARLRKEIASLIVRAKAPVEDLLKIVVDYSMTLAEMIATGHYDWVNSDITAERFPIKRNGKVETAVELIHFNRVISSGDAEKELDKMGLRPARIEELLAFGATFPEIQRKFPIIALGAVAEIDGNRHVVYLHRDDSERDLRLYWHDFDWSEACRFLAVRNK